MCNIYKGICLFQLIYLIWSEMHYSCFLFFFFLLHVCIRLQRFGWTLCWNNRPEWMLIVQSHVAQLLPFFWAGEGLFNTRCSWTSCPSHIFFFSFFFCLLFLFLFMFFGAVLLLFFWYLGDVNLALKPLPPLYMILKARLDVKEPFWLWVLLNLSEFHEPCELFCIAA